MHPDTPATRYRLELDLRRAWPTWFARPTVVVGGRGHPAQWGVGTWQLTSGEPAAFSVFLFNRIWKYGAAAVTVDPAVVVGLRYRAPWLPFLRGRLIVMTREDQRP